MTENQGPVTGAGSQEGDGRRGAEARTRELRVRGVEAGQGGISGLGEPGRN